jgi:flagellin
MLSAATNISGLIAQRAFNTATRDVQTSFERLATGKKINRASDDPSGMVSAEHLVTQEKTITKRIESIDREDAMLGAKEGAESVLSDQLLELGGLVVQNANSAGLTEEERKSIQTRTNSVLSTIDFLSNTQTFKGQQIISGFNSLTLGKITRTDPQHPDQTHQLSLASLGGNGLSSLSAEDAQAVVTAASEGLSGHRAAIGARMDQLQSERRVSLSELENTSAARSAIQDTDYGIETAKLVRSQTLQSAALYTQQLASRQQADMVLELLHSVKPPTTIIVQVQ